MVARSNSTAEKEPEVGEQVMKGKEGVEICFPLMELPPELWINICRLAATPESPIKLRGDDLNRPAYRAALRGLGVQPAITRVSKVVRDETISSFCSSSVVYRECESELDTEFWTEWAPGWIKAAGQHRLLNLFVECRQADGVYHTDRVERLGLDLTLVEAQRSESTDGECKVYKVVLCQHAKPG
ncbi:hypothetical protein LTR56_001428 [Elasticomyces elasticus]|nr:hypothetical protein LTR56_001428 [Elasticomyces elasticus]KAK3668648.1 hypothetical protein LTR22_000535 [Elasticomyces elasticus]KAK4932000.1 hypothetical protein LTR49_001687 [Elasticomyces elasticus]KAK5768468.1 hypothetical protein LTS12_001256 [Elasticomyces elasticus]